VGRGPRRGSCTACWPGARRRWPRSSSASTRPHCGAVRCGAAGAKKYVLSASTENATAYHLGGRDLDSFAEAGILPAFAGVAVHDRYRDYFHRRWANLAGHQACNSQLLRDFADADEAHPDQHWPAQAQRALRGLIRAWHTARAAGMTEIAKPLRDPLTPEFRCAIRVGLAQVPRVPGPRHSTAQQPRAGAAGVLPRPRERRSPFLLRHPDLAHEQHQRARPAAHQDTAEDLRSAHQRGRHPRPARYPQLHRHRPQTRRRCHHRTAAGHHRNPLETSDPGTCINARHHRSHHHTHTAHSGHRHARGT
jgi:hypothetical protein